MAQEAIALKAEVCWWCFLTEDSEQKPASLVLVMDLLLNSSVEWSSICLSKVVKII